MLGDQEGPLVAAVEAGGTSFRVALARSADPACILERASFRTTSPEETLRAVGQWLEERQEGVLGVGVISFGPVDLDEDSPTYGHITTTPKVKWQHTDLLGPLRERGLRVLGFETDVNAPALMEAQLRGVKNCCYITVGTGVGVGVVVDGKCVHGLLHPEAGHMRAVPAPADLDGKGGVRFGGVCPFHGSCVEGMCSAPAVAERLGLSQEQLHEVPDEDPVWDSVANYLAQLCANLVLMCSPQVIVLGGGVSERKCIFPLVRKHLLSLLNGYIQHPKLTEEGVDSFVVSPTHSGDAGIASALALALIAAPAAPQ